MKYKKVIKHHFLILILIIILCLAINLHWILFHSPEYNSEDMIILGKSLNMIKSKEPILLSNIYFMNTQPVYPTMMYYGLKYFPNLNTPLLINWFFWILLIIVTYQLTYLIYNKKAALLSAFLVVTTPGIIGSSRVIYSGFILSSLFMLSIFFIIKSNFFKNRTWSLLWAITSAICLLTKYSMIPYVASVIGFCIFILVKNKKFSKPVLNNFLISIALLLIICVPHYLFEENLSTYKSRAVFPESDKGTVHTFFCDVINYPYLLLNDQLGLILTLFLVSAIIASLVRLKKREKMTHGKILIIFIIACVFGVFTFFIKLKSADVIGYLIPLLIVLISGFTISLKKKIQVSLIIFLLINGLIWIIPISFPEQINNPTEINKIKNQINCYSGTNDHFTTNTYKFFNKDIFFGKDQLLDYNKKTDSMKKIIENSHELSTDNNVILLDISYANHFELELYSHIKNPNIMFRYERCEDLYLHPDVYDEIEFILQSNSLKDKMSKGTKNFPDMSVIFCNKIRDLISKETGNNIIYQDSKHILLHRQI